MATSKLRSITQQQAAEILDQFVTEAVQNSNNLIVKKRQNLGVFGVYVIKQIDTNFCVYKKDFLRYEFNSCKTALGWCIADYHCQHDLAARLVQSDKAVYRRYTDLQYLKLARANSLEFDHSAVLLDRISDAAVKYQCAKNQWDKSINLAKYWHTKGLENETYRS